MTTQTTNAHRLGRAVKLLMPLLLVASVLSLGASSAAALPDITIDFTVTQPVNYAGGQNVAACTSAPAVEVIDADTLHLTDNCWQAVDITGYTITPNTMLELDFEAAGQGEIHGVGFDNDLGLTPGNFFQLYGTQTWGIQTYRTYPGAGPVHYTIPVGALFGPGTFDWLFFANDDDFSPLEADVTYSNVMLYEATPVALDLLRVNDGGYLPVSYAGSQDAAGVPAVIESDGHALRVAGNAWKKIDLGVPFNVGLDTVLEFDFTAIGEADIHGIGFDDDDGISPGRTFQVHGDQPWGIQAFNNYDGSGRTTHYEIPVGAYFTGAFQYLVFVNDDDGAPFGEGIFSNIEIHARDTIVFGPAPRPHHDPAPVLPEDNDFTVTATSIEPVTYSVVSGPCELQDAGAGVVRSTGGGDCVVQAATTGSADYLPEVATLTVPMTAEHYDLYAVTGAWGVPGSTDTLPVLGYSFDDAPVTHVGGPTLHVREGDVVTVDLYNTLDVATSVLFTGQTMIPDTVGAAADDGLDTVYPTAAYALNGPTAGTYLYEAGLVAGTTYQTAMGLHGALVVHPATADTAYGTGTEFDYEAVVLLSEIDPALNTAADPATFDMHYYEPSYFLINGEAHPRTTDLVDLDLTGARDTVLLRYINAGQTHHSMAVTGTSQTIVGLGGNELTFARRMGAESWGAGDTADVLLTVSDAAPAGTKIPVYDANLLHHNVGDPSSGGMVTFLHVATSDAAPTTAPMITSLSIDAGTAPGPYTISATGVNVASAEYFLVGEQTIGAPADFGWPGPLTGVTVDPGTTKLYVRPFDGLGNPGPLASIDLDGGDPDAPAITGVSFSQVYNPDGTLNTDQLLLRFTGDDSATGGSNIVSGTSSEGSLVGPNALDPIAAFEVLVPNMPGDELTVTATDAAGNVGASGVITIPGPSVSGVAFDFGGTSALTATVTSIDGVNIAGAVAYLWPTSTAPGDLLAAAVQMVAVDGVFDDTSEVVTVQVDTNGLAATTYTIYVRGEDVNGLVSPLAVTTFEVVAP